MIIWNGLDWTVQIQIIKLLSNDLTINIYHEHQTKW